MPAPEFDPDLVYSPPDVVDSTDPDAGVRYHDVGSSNIHSIGYRADNLTLFVRFKDKDTGAVSSRYMYFNVYPDVFRELMAAESHGKYLAANVKNRFSYQKFESSVL